MTRYQDERQDELAAVRASKKISEMNEAELLKFLRKASNDLTASVDRLEALAAEREDDTGAGSNSA